MHTRRGRKGEETNETGPRQSTERRKHREGGDAGYTQRVSYRNLCRAICFYLAAINKIWTQSQSEMKWMEYLSSLCAEVAVVHQRWDIDVVN